MTPEFENLIDTLSAATLLGAGESDPRMRQSIAYFAIDVSFDLSPDTDFIDPILLTYLEKVTRHPYKVMDRDIEILLNHGYSEDEVFEITLSVALGAGLARWNRGMALLDETGAEDQVEFDLELAYA